MTTKKSAPATRHDQGKKNIANFEKDIKSPAARQENIDPDLLEIIQRAQSHAPMKEDEIQRWETDQAKLTDYETFANEVAQAGQIPEQQIFSFIPHQMAKTSVFFPMSRRDMTEEARRVTRIEHQTPWGMITIEGVKLAIYEEDILLTLFQVIGKHNTLKKSDYGYLLETNLSNIASALYGQAGYTQATYNRVIATLHHFQLVRFELTTELTRKKGKEKVKTSYSRSIGNIVSRVEYDKTFQSKDIKIYFNPGFFEFFLESMLTNINLTVRRRLKSDGAKALLRFISAHNHPGRMHILTILGAINYNINQPMYRLRNRLRGFIKELKTQKILGPKTRVYKDDTVYFDVARNYPKSLPKK